MNTNNTLINEKILSNSILAGDVVENDNGTFSAALPDEGIIDDTELTRNEMLDECDDIREMMDNTCHSILAVFVSGSARATVYDNNDVQSISFDCAYPSRGNEPDWIDDFSCRHLDDLAIVTAKARNFIGRSRRQRAAYFMRVQIQDALASA